MKMFWQQVMILLEFIGVCSFQRFRLSQFEYILQSNKPS